MRGGHSRGQLKRSLSNIVCALAKTEVDNSDVLRIIVGHVNQWVA